jgi:O-antigen/teichoic acid export membrane protein
MFWRGVLGYLPVNIVQAIAGFGSIVVFTRILSPTDYGAYALAYSVYALVNTVLFTWIEAAMARFYAVETARRADLFATLYKTFAFMALLLPIVAAALLVVLPISGALKLAVASGLGSAVVRSLLKLAQERRRAAGEVRGFAVYDIAQTGGGFLVGIAMAYGGFGGSAPLLGAGVASAACLIWALPAELQHMRGGRFDGIKLRVYMAYGVPIALSLLMSLALATTDRFVLAGYMTEATVGAYHAGYNLSNRTLDVMFAWLGMAGGPACIMALERGGPAALIKTAREQAGFMVLIALPAAVGLALTAAPLADIMVGPALRASAARVTPWIAISALFSGLTTYYLHTAFTLSRKTRRLIVAMAIPAAANLALTLILIPRFGLDGAMWATTASYALGMIASYTLGRSALPLPIPWTTLAQGGAATAAMVVIVLRLPSFGGIWELGLKAGVGAMVYGGVALALNAGGARSYGAQLLQGLKLKLVA